MAKQRKKVVPPKATERRAKEMASLIAVGVKHPAGRMVLTGVTGLLATLVELSESKMAHR